tara:strand:- start:528 stop:1160 length:633 start_codon:yes stop_codon:yes gene_type:complete
MENRVPIGEYESFIGTYHGVLNREWCQDVIREFDYFHDIGSTWCGDEQFANSLSGRFDFAIDLHHMGNVRAGVEYSNDLNERLFTCFEEYVHMFGTLKTQKYYSTVQKIQKTPAGGGYHVWHHENPYTLQDADSNRIAVWMLYLNDDYKGGETEFLYYKKRVEPEQGKLIIWPAGYTHAHRGGLVLEGNKYVITGWFNNSMFNTIMEEEE